MSEHNLISTVEELKEMEALLEECKAQVEALKDALKAELNANHTDCMQVGQYIIRNTEVLSSRFDTKAFKKDFGADAYAEYCKQVVSHRFSVSA